MMWLVTKILNPVVTELFIGGRKLGVPIAFTMPLYLKVLKDVRLNSTHYFNMKIPNKRELQQTASNPSSDIHFKDFMKIFKKCIKTIFFLSWSYNFTIR